MNYNPLIQYHWGALISNSLEQLFKVTSVAHQLYQIRRTLTVVLTETNLLDSSI